MPNHIMLMNYNKHLEKWGYIPGGHNTDLYQNQKENQFAQTCLPIIYVFHNGMNKRPPGFQVYLRTQIYIE